MVPGLSEVAVLAVLILGFAVFTGLGAGLVLRVLRGVRRFDPLAVQPPSETPRLPGADGHGGRRDGGTGGGHPGS